MYFIPKNNRIYSFLITLPLAGWYVISVTATVIVMASIWFLVVQPTDRHLRILHDEYQSLLEQKIAMHAVEREHSSLQKEVADLKVRIKQEMEQIPEYRFVLNSLLLRAIEVDVAIVSCAHKEKKIKQGYNSEHVQLTLQGTFEQILSFLKIVGSPDSCIGLKQLSVEKRDGDPKQPLFVQCELTLPEVNYREYADV
jgi:Tfp pilus assembly protein PilO